METTDALHAKHDRSAVGVEMLQVGTTIDVIGLVAEQRSIVERKPQNGIHEEFLMQLAVENFAWQETHPTSRLSIIAPAAESPKGKKLPSFCAFLLHDLKKNCRSCFEGYDNR
jgi:hypothetical protein